MLLIIKPSCVPPSVSSSVVIDYENVEGKLKAQDVFTSYFANSGQITASFCVTEELEIPDTDIEIIFERFVSGLTIRHTELTVDIGISDDIFDEDNELIMK
ncbi:uncharacterized protein LOC136029430 isoform X1 [Artemia franciscana]|uniref:uncharacterized protein LOC136029430 isoform X1 n=1 Tax=Artemia franciscana TaxID=6661 RepID=UPI0032DA9C28